MSPVRRKWGRRTAIFAVAVAVPYLLLRHFDFGPRLVPFALLVAVGFAGVLVVLDTLEDRTGEWQVGAGSTGREVGGDPRLAAYLRIVESHLTAGSPDGVLRDRLAALADRRLRQRYGVRRPSPEAAHLLGPELTEILASPARRLTVPQLNRLLDRIEDL